MSANELRTIQIAVLAGWDSDNPAATWGGLLGFILGRQGVQSAFPEVDLSEAYWIHRTRRGFPDLTPGEVGEDSFTRLAAGGVQIVDRVVENYLGGRVNREAGQWLIPQRP